MTAMSDPLDLVRQENPVPPGSLHALAAERADELLAKLRANEVAGSPLPATRRRGYVYGLAAALVAAAAAGAYVLAAPARSPQATSVPSSTVPTGAGPSGTPVTTAAQADALLPFRVVLPSNAKPQDMNVYRWNGRRQLQAHFSTRHGAYSLTEEAKTSTVSALRHRARAWKTASTRFVVVRGIHVLVASYRTMSQHQTAVAWIRGDGAARVVTWLVGPFIVGHSFTERQALAVARDVIRQGG